MDFYVFTQDYVKLGAASTPTAAIYSEKFQSLGDFELFLPLDETNVTLMKKERIVLLNKTKRIAGIIGVIKREKSQDDSPVLHVKGTLCEEYIYRRICWGLYNKTGKAGAVIYDMITSQVISPTNPERAISDITLDASGATLGPQISFQSTGKNVGENIEAICQANSLGFRMKYDGTGKQMIFSVYEGVNRTLSQKVVPPCIFSSMYENILSSNYTLNSQQEKNVGLVMGEGEGTARKSITVGAGQGKNRKETLIDARDLQSTDESGNAMSEADYLALLKQRGNEKMSEFKNAESFECVVNTNGNIQYDKDYFLGDKVTIFDVELGIQLDAVISEVEHTFNSEGETTFITFGFGPMSLAQKLKAKVV